jgi:hypothetical protein
MCKSNYERKYSKYEIVLEYLNGDKETISYNDERVKTYNGAMAIYRETKEQYKDGCVTIKFVGVTETGELKVLFEKPIINKEMLDEYEKAKEISESNMLTLLGQLSESIENVFERSIYIRNQMPIQIK